MPDFNPNDRLAPDGVHAMYQRKPIFIPLSAITHFQADEKYVMVYSTHRKPVLITITLLAIEAFYGETVLQVHRNTLVVRKRLKVMHKQLGRMEGELWLTGSDECIAVSRRRVPFVRAAIKFEV